MLLCSLAEAIIQFTGSYSYSGFRSCIPINPWDKRMTAKAIHQVSLFVFLDIPHLIDRM